MTKNKYSFKIEENMACAAGKQLAISFKQAIEISSHIRKRPVERAKKILQDAIELKIAIPYKRFNGDVGHKKGMAAGRYPVKAAQAILALIESAEANAQFKGLNTSNLKIVHICAKQGVKSMHYGRKRGIQTKSTHMELVVEEGKAEKRKPTVAKKEEAKKPVEKKVEVKATEKKEVKPTEVKKEVPKAEVKTEVKKEAPKVEVKAVEKKVEEKKEVKKESQSQDQNKQKPEGVNE